MSTGKKKTIMRSLKIHEISAVDRPAQEHARMTLMKRAENPKQTKETNMSKFTAEQQAEVDALVKAAVTEAVTKANADAKVLADAEIATAKAIADLSDAEKTHFKSLDDAGKKEFLAKSADQRADVIKAEIAKAADKDPVIYKSDAGLEFRKSAGDQVISMAKQMDSQAKELAVAKADREIADFTKRGKELFPNLVGDDVVKAALLKSLESIPDADVRKKAIESVTAGDKAVSAAFKSVGNGKAPAADGSPQDEFDKGVAEHQKEQKLPSVAKATQSFIKTAKGKELYQAVENAKSN